jgi:hypothetical protein
MEVFRKNVNTPAKNGSTPLMQFVAGIRSDGSSTSGWERLQEPGFWDLLKKLIEAKADPNLRSRVNDSFSSEELDGSERTPIEVVNLIADVEFRERLLQELLRK